MLFAVIKLFVNFDFSVIMDKNQERSRVMRILMIEDEKLFGDKIAGSLRREGYEVDICYDGSSAMEHMSYESCDLILLDLNLPDIDGIEILRHLRSYDNETAVLILSARSQISDKVEGLDVGASDYLVKPFHLDELKARIRSLTRRRFIQNDVCLVCGRLRFDTKARKAFAEDREIVLTRKENGILEYLMLNEGRPVSQEEFMEHVWDGSVDNFSNSIRVHMSSLRKKLKAVLGYDPIRNRIGEGYQIGGEER